MDPSMSQVVHETLAAHPEWNLGEGGGAAETPAAPTGGSSGNGGTAPAPAATTESFTGIDPATLDPALQERYRQMQADYTRKTQELAERERAAQALQSQFDQYWQDQGQGMGQGKPAYAPDPDPYAGYESADPVVNTLLQRFGALETQLQQERQARQEQSRQTAIQGMQGQLDRLEGRLGRSLNEAEIRKTAPLIKTNPGLTVEQAYFLAHREERETEIKRAAAEEALRTLSQARQAPAAPSALAGRAGEPAAPTSARGFILDALKQHGIG